MNLEKEKIAKLEETPLRYAEAKLQLKSKRLHRIVIADALYHLLQCLPVSRIHAFLYPSANQTAQDMTEVVVSGE